MYTCRPMSPIAAPEAPARPSAPAAASTLPPGLRALVQLALMTVPAQPIRWVPNWEQRDAVTVRDAEHLGRLIAALGVEEFGGIEITGTRGPWCQVMNTGDGPADVMVELHPHVHDRVDEALIFERVMPITPEVAAEFAWYWVRGKGIPGGYELEMRIVPDGMNTDVAL